MIQSDSKQSCWVNTRLLTLPADPSVTADSWHGAATSSHLTSGSLWGYTDTQRCRPRSRSDPNIQQHQAYCEEKLRFIFLSFTTSILQNYPLRPAPFHHPPSQWPHVILSETPPAPVAPTCGRPWTVTSDLSVKGSSRRRDKRVLTAGSIEEHQATSTTWHTSVQEGKAFSRVVSGWVWFVKSSDTKECVKYIT